MSDLSNPPPQGTASKASAALVLSIGLGILGALLLVIGALLGSTAVFLGGFFGGALSLAAALYWRSELIAAHHSATPRGRTPGTY